MKQIKIAAALSVVAATALAATAGAHFMSATESVADSGALVVAFDEAGLGNQNVSYSLTAQGSAVYACFNGGGNHPAASNKVGPSALSATLSNVQPKNGRVIASITVGPPANTTLSCPSGQTLALACVSYTDVTLTDTTNQVEAVLSGTTSRTFVSGKGISC
ncbi:hypothetical protein ACPUER_30420 [Burkholderia sp. DN3021]|uniref:hypothetical protein n=1 Tax=Burkholderia sp. DN3021 TaxID=3410137 RepID=UPI003C7CB6BA